MLEGCAVTAVVCLNRKRDTSGGGGSAPTGPNAELVAAFEQVAHASQEAGARCSFSLVRARPCHQCRGGWAWLHMIGMRMPLLRRMWR